MPSHLRRVAANLDDAYRASTAALIATQDRLVKLANLILDDYGKELATATAARKDEIRSGINETMTSVSRAIATSIQHAKLPQAQPEALESLEDIKSSLLE